MLQNDQIQKLKLKFMSKTKNGHLNIKNYQELIEFEAVQELNVKSLFINQCNQMSPLIINKTVKELNISGCEPQIIDNLQFENLEVLHLHFNKVKDIQQFLKFQKLKKLNLTLNEGVNLSQIAQLNNLTILELGQCKLTNISDIKIYKNTSSRGATLIRKPRTGYNTTVIRQKSQKTKYRVLWSTQHCYAMHTYMLRRIGYVRQSNH
ncbi:Leucine-rich_repeat domain superfamily [Hexamita inflata]|uniref:Leucine-rich repeat domain superfamily n=1 Tax=Hexamita inflata TaxID=28002 RepID=A0AA86U3C7_9EUKA|nr:Leucine-rich repeat domain superfamily [Hexamita inflata]CAI9939013.1 Leucine-rich repeat domain superfamily [Hexamita inflata]